MRRTRSRCFVAKTRRQYDAIWARAFQCCLRCLIEDFIDDVGDVDFAGDVGDVDDVEDEDSVDLMMMMMMK